MHDMILFSRSLALCYAVGTFALVLLGGISPLSADPVAEQSRLELQLRASSQQIRVEVADIPAEERQFIEQDRPSFTAAVYGTPILTNDLDGMYKIEGRLSRCENRSLLRCNIQILEQFRKSGFRVDDACKRFFT